MKIKVNNIFMPLEHTVDEVYLEAMRKCSVKEEHIINKKILRRSVDARRDNVRFNYCVFFELNKNIKPNGFISAVYEDNEQEIPYMPLPYRPVIIGMGPAGLFAGYYLAKSGCRPIIFERGGSIEKRVDSTESFFFEGILDAECNIQFGEGGAGTFSDGKLTTRINDKRCDMVLDIFSKHGAPDDILYLAKPHIGTDLLRNVIKEMRKAIIEMGGEVQFDSKLEKINIKNDRLCSITVNGTEHECGTVLLAIGHSSRDTYKMLYECGVAMAPKPFAIGLRIEHLQHDIDTAQYGRFAGHPALGAADYRLAYNGKDRKCFSFCMCPGGSVVASSSEEFGVVVNGMSNHARDGKNSNSALVVNVTDKDFDGVLGGVEFQRKYERLAYASGGGRYYAPVQLATDFLDNKKSKKTGKVLPTYQIGYEFANLHDCLPKFVSQTLCDGIRYFDKKIKGFSKEAVLTGVETRTSAPLKILRGENMESLNVKGLYPIGEGAGYAGGIMSSAVDGIKAAEQLLRRH